MPGSGEKDLKDASSLGVEKSLTCRTLMNHYYQPEDGQTHQQTAPDQEYQWHELELGTLE